MPAEGLSSVEPALLLPGPPRKYSLAIVCPTSVTLSGIVKVPLTPEKIKSLIMTVVVTSGGQGLQEKIIAKK